MKRINVDKYFVDRNELSKLKGAAAAKIIKFRLDKTQYTYWHESRNIFSREE